MSRDPLFGYKDEALKQYFERNPAKAGQMLVLYNSAGLSHCYQLARVVDGDNGKQRRIVVAGIVDGEQLTFFRTGTCVSSKEKSYRLLPLVPWLVQRMAGQPKVIFDWTWRYAG